MVQENWAGMMSSSPTEAQCRASPWQDDGAECQETSWHGPDRVYRTNATSTIFHKGPKPPFNCLRPLSSLYVLGQLLTFTFNASQQIDLISYGL